jgi:flagellar motor switch protein FliN
MALRLAAPTVLRLAQAFMSEPATPEAELTADHREAVIELLRQVSGFVSTSAKRWGEVQLRVEATPAAPSWPAAATVWVRAGEDNLAAMNLEFVLSAALVAELRPLRTEAAKPGVAASETAKDNAGSATSLPTSDSGQGQGALELLMDVELVMTMRFGTRQLLLREVLELSPGSVVELDRRVQEPVDLLLDGKLIARGEVVVIDGSYGLRVTDVSALNPAGVV